MQGGGSKAKQALARNNPAAYVFYLTPATSLCSLVGSLLLERGRLLDALAGQEARLASAVSCVAGGVFLLLFFEFYLVREATSLLASPGLSALPLRARATSCLIPRLRTSAHVDPRRPVSSGSAHVVSHAVDTRRAQGAVYHHHRLRLSRRGATKTVET